MINLEPCPLFDTYGVSILTCKIQVQVGVGNSDFRSWIHILYFYKTSQSFQWTCSSNCCQWEYKGTHSFSLITVWFNLKCTLVITHALCHATVSYSHVGYYPTLQKISKMYLQNSEWVTSMTLQNLIRWWYA